MDRRQQPRLLAAAQPAYAVWLNWLPVSLTCVLTLVSTARGQGSFQPPEASSAVSRQIDQFDALVEDQLWDEAIDLIEKTQVEHGVEMIEISPDRFVPVSHRCQQLLCGLPAEGLTAYRRRTDSTAQRYLDEGITQLDVEPLRRVVDEMLATSSGGDAALALAELALSEGDTVAARRWFQRATPFASGPAGEPAGVSMATIDPSVDPEQLAVAWRVAPRPGVVAAVEDDVPLADVLVGLAVASVREGDPRRAAATLRLLKVVDPNAVGRIAGRDQRLVPALTALVAEADRVTARSTGRQTSASRSLGPLIDWSWKHSLGNSDQALRAAAIARQQRQRLIQLQQLGMPAANLRAGRRAVPRVVPSLGGSHVVWTDRGRLKTLDISTGLQAELPLPDDWSAPKPTPVKPPKPGSPIVQQRNGARFGRGAVIRNGQVRVLDNRGRLMALPPPIVSWVGRPVLSGDMLFGRVNRRTIQVTAPNRRRSQVEESLVGIDLRSEGKKVFDLTSSAIAEGDAWSFVGLPVIDEDRLYAFVAPTTNRGSLWLACYTRRPQRLLWKQRLGSGPAQTQGGEATTLTLGRDTVYCVTGSGAVAAIDREQGRLRWVRRYERQVVPKRTSTPPRPAVVRNGVLYAAPNDATDLLAINAATGNVIWTSPRDNPTAELVYVGRESVVLVGERIEWLDQQTGRLVRAWPESLHAGLRGQGRCAMVEDELFWPTRQTVYALNAESGGLTRPSIDLTPFGQEGVDLYAAGDGLLVVGPTFMALRGTDPMPAEPQVSERRPNPGFPVLYASRPP